MTYLDDLRVIFGAARGELRFVLNRIVADSYRTYNFLSSDEAVQTYRFIWSVVELAAFAAIVLGRITRIYWNRHVQPRIDSHVEWCSEDLSGFPGAAIPTHAMPAGQVIEEPNPIVRGEAKAHHPSAAQPVISVEAATIPVEFTVDTQSPCVELPDGDRSAEQQGLKFGGSGESRDHCAALSVSY